jgi:hypothetical protein
VKGSGEAESAIALPHPRNTRSLRGPNRGCQHAWFGNDQGGEVSILDRRLPPLIVVERFVAGVVWRGQATRTARPGETRELTTALLH